MTISIENTQQFQLVKVHGDFDAALAPEARQKFGELVTSTDKNVRMDLSKVEFIDSSGIGAIVFLYKRLRCAGYDLALEGLREQPNELISLLRIDKIIETKPFDG